MELIVHAMTSCLKILLWKIRYGKKIAVGIPASFGRRVGIYIKGKNASVEIAAKCVTRDNIVIRAENGRLKIGERCFFNGNTSITCIESIEIGSGCQFANNLVMIDHDHDFRKKGDGPLLSSPIRIGDNVWIGANCTILKGTHIGSNVVIGAGSVISGSIPDRSVCYQKRETTIKRIDD